MIRLVWIVILMWILSEALLPWEAYAAEVPQTNVVLILIDDFGWRDLGCYGNTYYQTPNIDRLAEQGMRFTNGYTPLDATALKKCSESKTRLAVADLLPELGGESKQSVNK